MKQKNVQDVNNNIIIFHFSFCVKFSQLRGL
jgi:hypothetical protein